MRYDYKCSKCNHAGVVSMSMKVDAKPIKCPGCGRRAFKRQITPNAFVLCLANIKYQNRFPYVSNTLPFGGSLAGDGEHVGPQKKIRVVNEQHERRLRKVHGYVGEPDIGKQVEI